MGNKFLCSATAALLLWKTQFIVFYRDNKFENFVEIVWKDLPSYNFIAFINYNWLFFNNYYNFSPAVLHLFFSCFGDVEQNVLFDDTAVGDVDCGQTNNTDTAEWTWDRTYHCKNKQRCAKLKQQIVLSFIFWIVNCSYEKIYRKNFAKWGAQHW